MAELSRIYLRFINVTDEKQLTGILSKILPSLVLVYLEADMVNVNIGTSPKVKQLDEIMQHLTTRVTFSKGAIKPPVSQLLNIINCETFNTFENQLVRTKVFTVIFGFIQAYSMTETVQEEDSQVFQITLEALKSDNLPMHHKCRLFVLCLHRMMQGYLNKKHPQGNHQLAEVLNVIFAADLTLKKAFVHFSLLLVIGMFPNWQNNLRVLFVQAMTAYFDQTGKQSQV